MKVRISIGKEGKGNGFGVDEREKGLKWKRSKRDDEMDRP